MSLNINMLVLRSGTRGHISSLMSNTFSSCSSSPLLLNLQTLSLFKTKLLCKNVSILKPKSRLKKQMSSLSATTIADDSTSDNSAAPKLTKQTANTLVMKLTTEERTTLLNTLQQFESEQLKAEYKGRQLGPSICDINLSY